MITDTLQHTFSFILLYIVLHLFQIIKQNFLLFTTVTLNGDKFVFTKQIALCIKPHMKNRD
jgi:hypothetical protein